MSETGLRAQDLDWLAARGIDEAEAARQVGLLRDAPTPPRLLRPATPRDGIELLGEDTAEADLRALERAGAKLRIERFVPASGAASRMFADLLAALETGEQSTSHPESLARFAREAGRLPFQRALAAAQGRTGSSAIGSALATDGAELVRALLLDDRHGLAECPKGLIPFHRYGDRERAAFEEHLHEWSALASGPSRLHYTVSPQHRSRFASALEAALPEVSAATGHRPEVTWSEQDPSTDTLALAEDGDLARDAEGHPLLRPGGHGALLRNLGARAAAGNDLVHLRNIDNVARAEDQPARIAVCRRLLGRLARLREQVFALLHDLDAGGAAALANAERFAVETLRRDAPRGTESERRETLRRWLDRPLRVAGMVLHEGEPGGGPFWSEDQDGLASLQIVEASQVDRDDPSQDGILRAATHFNPVDLACVLRDERGRAFELERFVDRRTWFRAAKSHGGRPIRVLERPGLWNGAMAGWLTVFVEIPASTFSPVKTVWDLLRPAHVGQEP
ncbi:MAG TPA: DUF4301 family protein [Thermoanaerobaculia bacterium]|nr:DUF4301 family protein [Thermoanaerobaculia bacterium]